MMTVDEALATLEQALKPKYLSDLQQVVFCRSWEGQSYEEIAESLMYDPGYIRDVGAQLWHLLSEVLGGRVTKKNVQSSLRRYQQEQGSLTVEKLAEKPDEKPLSFASVGDSVVDRHPELIGIEAIAPPSLELTPLEFPSGVVPLSSPLYIDRPPIEEQVCREISKPGSLVRIRAPRQMGKSSLMHRMMAHARQGGMQVATLDLQRADSEVFVSLNRFLRWLCANVSQQLELSPRLDDFWNVEMGSKMSCTLYFQRYILKAIDQALVLAFDEVNRLFEYPDLALDFLPLLRSWYEDASEFEIWQKLRLVVVHTTEAYIPLNINQSPFNVGLPIRLPELTLMQVQELALRHGLVWANTATGLEDLRSLVALVGGHPYLVRLALYALRQQIPLAQILREAPTPAGIYSEHLRHRLQDLQTHPELTIALKHILTEPGSSLEAVTLYKLESLGLVKLQGNEVSLSRQLYRLYFESQLKTKSAEDEP